MTTAEEHGSQDEKKNIVKAVALPLLSHASVQVEKKNTLLARTLACECHRVGDGSVDVFDEYHHALECHRASWEI